MSSVYWFGCRDFDPERHSIPGKAVLCGPYATREKAKAEKSIYNKKDFELTDIFTSENKESASLKLKDEQFSKL